MILNAIADLEIFLCCQKNYFAAWMSKHFHWEIIFLTQYLPTLENLENSRDFFWQTTNFKTNPYHLLLHFASKLYFCFHPILIVLLYSCRNLTELYIDNNLLDALPGIFLKINSLERVHRHGNHNYFKATFMWYHTDVNDRILECQGI